MTLLKNTLQNVLNDALEPVLGEVAGVVPPAGYSADAVVFDGTNDFLRKATDMTGNADGKNGLVSLWFKPNGSDGSDFDFYRGGDSRFFIDRNTSNKIFIEANSDRALIFVLHYDHLV